MSNNVHHIARAVQVAECNDCGNDAFWIAESNRLICCQCHAVVDGIEWIELPTFSVDNLVE